MKTILLAAVLLAASAGIAAADGWIDCNGPDKNGRGCNTSSADSTSTATGLALLGAFAFCISRRRVRGHDRNR